MEDNLFTHVDYLSSLEPFRSYRNPDSLNRAAGYIENLFHHYSLKTSTQRYQYEGNEYKNIIAFYGDPGLPKIIIGAHYDVCGDQPGADDNASGIAGLLELARLLSESKPDLKFQVELVAYTLEEPPAFETKYMGSYIHAKSLHEAEEAVELMISLEMIGYFTDKKGSQEYPSPMLKLVYPDRGNFIALIGRPDEDRFLEKFKTGIESVVPIGVESLAADPALVGVDFSDHRNYWEFGYSAIMVTDTSFYRNQNYHKSTDTIDTLDFKKMGEVVQGLYAALVGYQ